MYIGNSPLYQSFPRDRFDGGAASYTLTYNPQSAGALLVVVDGVVQDPINDYTTSGTTLTPTTAWPAGTDNVVVLYLGRSADIGTPSDDTVSTAKLQDEAVTEAKVEASVLTKSRPQLGTAQATTSGTDKDFTGIPSWVRRITVMFDNVSIDASANLQIQIGDSGGLETSGYISSAGQLRAVPSAARSTGAFLLTYGLGSNQFMSGSVELQLLDESTNTWVARGNLGDSAADEVFLSGGSKSLTATLDRLRVTTNTGTAVFDSGKINIMYE